LLQADAKCAA